MKPERASGVAFGGGFLKGFRSGALVEFFVCDGGLFCGDMTYLE